MKSDNRYAALGVDSDKVFLLDPSNRRFLLGRKLKPSFIPYTFPEYSIFGKFFTLLFGLAICIGVPLVFLSSLLPLAVARFGIQTQGTVTNTYIDQFKTGPSYKVNFLFSVNEQSYHMNELIDEQTYNVYHPGYVVNIRYFEPLPGIDPVIVDSSGYIITGVNTGVIFICMTALILYSGLLLLSIFKPSKSDNSDEKLHDAWLTAQLVVGKIVSCSTQIVPGKATKFMLTVRYTLYPPGSDETMVYQTTEMRNDLKNKPLPEAGTPVVAVYFMERVHFGGENHQGRML